MIKRFSLAFVVLFSLVGLSGCQSAYYGAMEKVGIHKRDIMVDRIEASQESQEEAQEQFRSALEQFRSVVAFDGGDLEDTYDSLNSEYENSVAAADDVKARIQAVRDVSEALFDEWQDELDLYSSQKLKQASKRKLDETKRSYQQMMTSMTQAEKRMEPVLSAFQDQVLYLKHNLNAQAIAAIRGEFKGIQSDIERLIRDMQQAIDRSNVFLKSLKTT